MREPVCPGRKNKAPHIPMNGICVKCDAVLPVPKFLVHGKVIAGLEAACKYRGEIFKAKGIVVAVEAA